MTRVDPPVVRTLACGHEVTAPSSVPTPALSCPRGCDPYPPR